MSSESWKGRTRSGSKLGCKRRREEQVQRIAKRQKRTYKVGTAKRQNGREKMIRRKTIESEEVVEARKRRDRWLQASRRWAATRALTEEELGGRLGITV